jgi:hypothetical protein
MFLLTVHKSSNQGDDQSARNVEHLRIWDESADPVSTKCLRMEKDKYEPSPDQPGKEERNTRL